MLNEFVERYNRQRHPHLCGRAASPRMRIAHERAGGGTHRKREDHEGVQPSLPPCAAHSKSYHLRYSHSGRARSTRKLLSLLSDIGCAKRPAQRGLLLYFHWRVPFPEGARAAEIAIQTVKKWQGQNPNWIEVIFNVFRDSDHEIYQRALRQNIPSQA